MNKDFKNSIADRLQELVNEQANGKHTVFSEKAGIPKSTFHFYIKGRMPHSEHLIHIRETFNVNIHWLLTGEGVKYLEKSDFEKEIPHSTDLDPEINDLLEKTREVLVSKTNYAEFLKTSVKSIHESLKVREEMKTMRSEINELKKHMTIDRRKGERRLKTDGVHIMDKAEDRRKGPDRRKPGPAK